MTCTCHCQHVSVSCQLVECIVTEPLMRQIYTEFMNNTVSKTNENWRCFVADDADHVPSHWFSNIESTATTKRVETQTAKSIFDWPGNMITMWCQQQQHVTQSQLACRQCAVLIDRGEARRADWLVRRRRVTESDSLGVFRRLKYFVIPRLTWLHSAVTHNAFLLLQHASVLRLLSAVNSSMGSG